MDAVLAYLRSFGRIRSYFGYLETAHKGDHLIAKKSSEL